MKFSIKTKFKSYDAYKACEELGLGSIPKHWEVWKMSHGYLIIGSGTTPKSDSEDYYDGNINWVTTSELREKEINETFTKVTQKALINYPTLTLYPKGSLAIAMYGATIGRLGIFNSNATVNQACCVFSLPTQFNQKFVFYWLLMRRPVLLSLSSGGGQPNLNQDTLRQIKIPVPSLQEQQSIAKFLDQKTKQIDDLIEQKEKLLQLLTEKRTAIITQAVTKGLSPKVKMKDSGIEWLGEVPGHWDLKRLRFLAHINPVKSELKETVDVLVSFVPMEAVGEYGGLTLDTEKEISEVYNGYTYFRNNDVVVAKITPCFENGKGALASNLKNGIAFGTTELHVLRGELLDSKYVFYLSISDFFRKTGEAWMYGAGGQKRVPEEFLKDVILPIPPPSEQSQIGEWLEKRIEALHSSQNAIVASIKKLKEYRDALITSAVTGQIDVRNL